MFVFFNVCVYLKMHSSSYFFMPILLMIADGFTVKGPSVPLVVPLGGSVLLPCSVDSLLSLKDLEVKWKRSDSQTLIHLYQDGDIRPEVQNEDYHDRAHFFTDNIKRGNFSLLLKNVTAEDEGHYTCTVHSRHESHETVVEVSLNYFGLSVLHIMVLILCISACGSALLFSSLIYCRSNNTNLRLQMSLVFCPNIFMFFAFVFWGVSEGSPIETVSCCSLYIVRPLMLLWAAPYVQQFTGNIKTWILFFSFRTEYIVFSAVLYSVLFYSAWRRGLGYAGFEGIMIIVLFGFVLLFCLFYSIFSSPLVRRSVWSVMMLLVTALMMLFYITALENEKDRAGWACKVAFLQVLWTIWSFSRSFTDEDFPRITSVYLFGSVGVVLISAVALITELILKIGIKPSLQSCQARAKSKRTRKPPSTDATETEMNSLNTQAGEAQPDSVESQT